MTAALSPETLAFDTAEVGIEPLRIGNERAEISFTLELITPELAAAYQFEHLTEAQWADWYEGLTTGANLSLGDPRLHLRRAFERIQKSESQNRRPNVAMAYYLKALRAWAQGQGYGPKGLRLGGTEGVDKNIRAAWRSIGSTEG